MAIGYCKENYCGLSNKAGLYLRTVSGEAPYPLVMRIGVIIGNSEVDFEVDFSGESLELTTSCGNITICFSDKNTLLFYGSSGNIGVIFDEISQKDSCNYIHRIIPDNDSIVLINCYKNHTRHLLGINYGNTNITQLWDSEEAHNCSISLTAQNDCLSFFLRNVESDVDCTPPILDITEAKASAKKEIDSFNPCGKITRIAAYLQFASIVSPKGNYKREAMLMSKNWMTNVWAWDHCFNAISLCYTNPKLAYDQFIIMFDHQCEDGLIPDFIGDATLFFNCCKPPIHGFAFGCMMKIISFSNEQLQDVYTKLSIWTDWWLTKRDYDKDGLCEYWHGNDSGWDNSTVFKDGPCVISPDLTGFLIVQMDTLCDIASRLEKHNESLEWKNKADMLTTLMLQYQFVDDLPVALDATTKEPILCESLLPYLCLLTGKRLPENTRSKMIDILCSDRFFTEYGFTTESQKSQLFCENGYWRGAIWPPVMFIMVEALERCGEKDFARNAAIAFCNMTKQNSFAENYSCITGEGLRDRAYTWAASIFMIFVMRYFQDDL